MQKISNDLENLIMGILCEQIGESNMFCIEKSHEEDMTFVSFRINKMKIVIRMDDVSVYRTQKVIIPMLGEKEALIQDDTTEILQDSIRSKIESVANRRMVW